MGPVTLGDMAQFFLLRTNMNSIQKSLNDRVEELSTSEVADKTSTLGGNFTEFSAIEHSLSVGESFLSVINSAETFLSAQVLAFERARSYAPGTGVALIDASQSVDQTARDSVLAESRTSFNAIISALNSQTAGRSLFAGAATQGAAFASSSDILTAFEAAISGATTSGDVIAIADVWFGAGGAYEGTAYLGSDTPLDGFLVSESEIVAPDLSGYDSDVRNLVKLHAISAALSDGVPALIDAEKSNLMSAVGDDLVNLDRVLIAKQAELGATQERIDMLLVERQAEQFSLMEYRKSLVGKDVSETALQLSELESQMEAIYAVTARIARLSLTNYL